MLIDMWTSMGY